MSDVTVTDSVPLPNISSLDGFQSDRRRLANQIDELQRPTFETDIRIGDRQRGCTKSFGAERERIRLGHENWPPMDVAYRSGERRFNA